MSSGKFHSPRQQVDSFFKSYPHLLAVEWKMMCLNQIHIIMHQQVHFELNWIERNKIYERIHNIEYSIH